MSSLDEQLKRISGKVALRDTVESLNDGDQAILVVWRANGEPYDGKRHVVQVGCDTKATLCYILGLFLHDEYEGRFDPPEPEGR